MALWRDIRWNVLETGTVSGDSKEGFGGNAPPNFWLPPSLAPLFFLLNFTFKFVWLNHTADNFRPAIFYICVGPAVPPHFFHSRIATGYRTWSNQRTEEVERTYPSRIPGSTCGTPAAPGSCCKGWANTWRWR